jgi:hypothetical protein
METTGACGAGLNHEILEILKRLAARGDCQDDFNHELHEFTRMAAAAQGNAGWETTGG